MSNTNCITPSEIPCNYCGKLFVPDKWRYAHSKTHYCSVECRVAFNRGKMCICKACGKEFYATMSKINYGRGKHCSIECRAESQHDRRTPTEELFWNSVQKTDTCWLWKTKGTYGGGYGLMSVRDTIPNILIPAHRYSWELHNGPIPEGMFVCHHCDNPPCVNPEHLFLGTYMDNIIDMCNKGRQPRGNTHGNAILTEKDIPVIRQLIASGVKQVRISEMYHISSTSIANVRKGKTWRHIS